MTTPTPTYANGAEPTHTQCKYGLHTSRVIA